MTKWSGIALVGLFTGCSTGGPEVTPEMAALNTGGTLAFTQLKQGRTLFASRCIECHALPGVTAHTAGEWPDLIDEMADRASLDPAERQAVLAYILAARAGTSSPR